MAVRRLFAVAICLPVFALVPCRAQAQSAGQVASGKATIVIQRFQYHPDKLVVTKGTEVTFINKDKELHTVSPDWGAQFLFIAGIDYDQQKKRVFEIVGRHKYHCDNHNDMEGVIYVVEEGQPPPPEFFQKESSPTGKH